MRLLFALAVVVAALTVAHDPKLKLTPSNNWRLDATVQSTREKDMWSDERYFVLSIKGGVVNDASEERAVPLIRLSVFDDQEREIYHWTVMADAPRAKPHQRITFSARIESPPPEGVGVGVQIAESK